MAETPAEVYRVKEAFAVPGPQGFLRTYATGALLAGSDPLATTHRAYLEPVAGAVEAATANPGERRGLRLPSRVRLTQATEHNTGHAHTTGAATMPHALPPEHEDSPASVFATEQPAAGVVADDVSDEQNKANAPKAAQVVAEQVKTTEKNRK